LILDKRSKYSADSVASRSCYTLSGYALNSTHQVHLMIWGRKWTGLATRRVETTNSFFSKLIQLLPL